MHLKRAGTNFKGVLSVSEDSSLGSKQNTSWLGISLKGTCHKRLFISHDGNTVMCRKYITSSRWQQVGTDTRNLELCRFEGQMRFCLDQFY